MNHNNSSKSSEDSGYPAYPSYGGYPNYPNYPNYPAGGGGESETGGTTPILQVLFAVLKRPWIPLGVLVIVMVPFLYNVYSEIPLYQSVGVVQLQVATRMSPMIYQTQQALGSSAMPEEFYTSILGSNSYFLAVTQSISTLMPFLPKDSLAAVVRLNIKYQKTSETGSFLAVAANSQNPDFAQVLAEQAIIVFQEKNVEIRKSDNQGVLDFIDRQLEELSAKLIANEVHLRDFLAERGLNYSDVAKGLDNELTILQRSLSDAEAARDMAKLQIDTYSSQIQERLDAMVSAHKPDDQTTQLKNRLDELNRALSENEIGKLDSFELRDTQDERKRIVTELVGGGLNSTDETSTTSKLKIQNYEQRLEEVLLTYETSLINITFYDGAVQRFKREHPNLSQDILDYFTITRSKQVIQSTIDLLVSQRETLRIRAASEGGGIKVIDNPTRGRLIALNRSKKIITFFLIAMAVGILLAYAIDLLDNTIQSENDIINRFGIAVYGSVPVLDSRRFTLDAKKRHPGQTVAKGSNGSDDEDELDIDITLLNNHPESSPIAEAYRSIRIALQFTAKEKNQKVFVISSSVASEGKSITTYNVGVSFAQSGVKVCLLDADLRRPTQHKKARIRRTPGLADLLLEQASYEEATVSNVIPNFDIIPAGMRIKNPADLLSSKRMATILEKLEAEYDLILIDTPPITPCMDSRHLATMTKGIVLVARAEVTKRNILEHAIGLCRRVNVEIEGMIVNHVQFRYGYGYYYVYQRYNPNSYGYYYSGYAYYYSQDPETGERTKKRKARKPQEVLPQDQPPENSV